MFMYAPVRIRECIVKPCFIAAPYKGLKMYQYVKDRFSERKVKLV